MLNINNIEFTEAPQSFDHTGDLMNILIADLDDNRQAIIGFDIDTQKSSITVGNPTTGKWASSADTQDWPALDRLFGRADWQQFVAEHQEETLAELDDEE